MMMQHLSISFFAIACVPGKPYKILLHKSVSDSQSTTYEHIKVYISIGAILACTECLNYFLTILISAF
jgi:hypothetical protein